VGVSALTGFSHLVHKESDRLAKVQELLRLLGRRFEVVGSEFLIYGDPRPFTATGRIDPDHDHRMAMAAQVANLGGAHLQIQDKAVVNKSFPEFWPIVEAL
jgi:5-enolpyruvylshikimate-3-phosphate synthase